MCEHLHQVHLQEINVTHILANLVNDMVFGLEWRALTNYMVTALGSCVK
jgi:hypothetical protein